MMVGLLLKGVKAKAMSFDYITSLPAALDKYPTDTPEKVSKVTTACELLIAVRDWSNAYYSGIVDETMDEDDVAAKRMMLHEVASRLAGVLQELVAAADLPKLPNEPVPWAGAKRKSSAAAGSGVPASAAQGGGAPAGAAQG